MEKTYNHALTAQHLHHQTAPEIQAYGSVSHSLPLELEEPVCLGDNRTPEPIACRYDHHS